MSTKSSTSQAPLCDHLTLRFTASSNANEVGYRGFTSQQRAIAAGRKKLQTLEPQSVFPAPLCLPGDELSFDPRYSPQSLRSWIRERQRNEVTSERNRLYIVGPPRIGAAVEYVREWATAQRERGSANASLVHPRSQDVVDYLAAFYHGMQVRLLPPDSLCFTEWGDKKGRKAKIRPKLIGLNTTTESVGIRIRPSPDGLFQCQLNLDDLLDTAISIVPDNAYALLMLVEQDLFEDEDDDFCCGRAYGGSRVAVVSMARYKSKP